MKKVDLNAFKQLYVDWHDGGQVYQWMNRACKMTGLNWRQFITIGCASGIARSEVENAFNREECSQALCAFIKKHSPCILRRLEKYAQAQEDGLKRVEGKSIKEWAALAEQDALTLPPPVQKELIKQNLLEENLTVNLTQMMLLRIKEKVL